MEDRIELLSGQFWASNPHEELAWLRANAPVWKDPKSGVWGVATYDLIQHVSKHPELFSSAQGIRPEHSGVPSMVDSDDPLHIQRRSLIHKGFTPRRVKDQEPPVRATARDLLQKAAAKGTFDMVTDVAAWLPLVTIGDLLGVPAEDHQQLLTWSDDLMGALGNPDPALKEAQGAAAIGWFGYATKMVEDRRGCPKDDLISILVGAEIDGQRLSDNDLVYESMLLLIGGDETSRHVMSGGTYQLLLEREDRWDAVRDDRSLLPGAIEEMLRWVSPIKNMARTATQDVELGGEKIREGEKLILMYPSANRDESVFDDPYTFDIRRTPNEHLAFGHGPHFCLGRNLARLELQVLFEEMFDLVPGLQLVEDAEPHYRPSNFTSGYESLPVRVG